MRSMTSVLAVVVAVAMSTDATARLRVVATVPALGAIAREVGGDRVDVRVLAAAGEDPHFVDPRPDLILELNRADLLVENGLDLESGWLPALVASARNGSIQAGGKGRLDAGAFVRRLEVPARPDRAAGDIHAGGNPHYLYDARAAAAVVEAVAARLSELDPVGAGGYAGRAAVLVSGLREVAREAAERVRRLPAGRRGVVVYHRSFPYLLDWLGLTEIAAIEPRPGIPPDPAHVSWVLVRMKETGTRVILQEAFYPRKTSDTLARLAGGEVVVVPAAPADGLAAWYRALAREVTDAVAR